MTRGHEPVERLELVVAGEKAAEVAGSKAFARDVRAGLTAMPKHLPCQYFYDRRGSILYERICALPEYYPSRAGAEIVERHAAEIAARCPLGTTLVELGSGSSAKTRPLIDALLRRQGSLEYVPMDIATGMLRDSALALLRDYPKLRIRAIAGEYEDALQELAPDPERPKLVLWLGSSIGNLHRDEAIAFLRRVDAVLTPRDRALVGVDLRKDRRTLELAYDDSLGITARFNKNLLARINRELGGHFDLETFRHRATYDERAGRVEIHLVSEREQQVPIDTLGIEVAFAEGETIHTENSYKYSTQEIDESAKAAHFAIEARWYDAQRRFTQNLLAPVSS